MFLNNLFSQKAYLIVTIAVVAINYVFKALGLYSIARSKSLKHKWMAFVPVANSYLLGEIAGPTNIFVSRIKNTGLMLFIAHLSLTILRAAFYVFVYLPFIKGIFSGTYSILQIFKGIPSDAIVSNAAINALEAVISFASLGYILLFISALFALFRKYEPERYMWYAIASIFLNVEGIFIFLIRTKKEIDYEKYVKQKYAQYRNFDPYNPNNQRGNYQGGNYQQGQNYPNSTPKSPFEEFEEHKPQEKKEEIFPEFDKKSSFDPYKNDDKDGDNKN